MNTNNQNIINERPSSTLEQSTMIMSKSSSTTTAKQQSSPKSLKSINNNDHDSIDHDDDNDSIDDDSIDDDDMYDLTYDRFNIVNIIDSNSNANDKIEKLILYEHDDNRINDNQRHMNDHRQQQKMKSKIEIVYNNNSHDHDHEAMNNDHSKPTTPVKSSKFKVDTCEFLQSNKSKQQPQQQPQQQIEIRFTQRQQEVIVSTLKHRKRQPRPRVDVSDASADNHSNKNNSPGDDDTSNDSDNDRSRVMTKKPVKPDRKMNNDHPLKSYYSTSDLTNLMMIDDDDNGKQRSSSSANSNSNNSSTKKLRNRLHNRIKRFLFNRNVSKSKRITSDCGGHGGRNSDQTIVNNHNNHRDCSNNNSHGYDRSSIRVKYFKYNASYRKVSRVKKLNQIESQSIQLLESIPLLYDEFDLINDQSISSNDEDQNQRILREQSSLVFKNFGIRFEFDDKHQNIVDLSYQQNLTYCDDFTKSLAAIVQALALVELQADIGQSLKLFSIDSPPPSTYEITGPIFMKNRKLFPSSLLKNGDHHNQIFGGNLTRLHLRDIERNNMDDEMPTLLKYMIDYLTENGLKEEGIFRVSGTKNRLIKLQEEITTLYESYYKHNKKDDRNEIFKIFKRYSIHDICSLLKLFLRQLQPPLLTNELMNIFLLIPKIRNVFIQIKILNLLMLSLNETHRNSLNSLLKLINLIVKFKHKNLITLDSISTLLVANLFTNNHANNQHQQQQQLLPNLSQKRTSIAAIMVNNSNENSSQQSKSSLNGHNMKRISLSNQSINEISRQMQHQLEYTHNSMIIFKLLINLQPILFHIPPYLEMQIYKHENGDNDGYNGHNGHKTR